FGKYGLRLHPKKTRLVPFERPAWDVTQPPPKPATFDMLGFTHFWGLSRNGNWVIKRKTAKDRKRRALKALNEWCRANRHRPVPEQWRVLYRKLRGLYAYYGIIGNVHSLQGLWFRVRRIWKKWLNRRSQRGRMPWARFHQLLRAFPLPMPYRMVQA
ncbi:MAG: RNA-directed DNA polymerase, partial [Thiohalorhabdaceae bacterium]